MPNARNKCSGPNSADFVYRSRRNRQTGSATTVAKVLLEVRQAEFAVCISCTDGPQAQLGRKIHHPIIGKGRRQRRTTVRHPRSAAY